MAKDTLEIEILEDGTIKTQTDHFSAAHHQSAEEFLQEITRQAGGPMQRNRNPHKKHVGHSHVHAHNQS